MTLATLVHAAAPAPPFNINFFIVAATVIPVLYLALTLQGTIFDRALRAAHSARRTAFRPKSGQSYISTFVHYQAATTIRIILSLLMVAGTYGEILALYALYQQQASTGTQRFVLASAIALAAATIAQPIFTSTSIAYNAASKPLRPGQDQQTTTETGKTDAA